MSKPNSSVRDLWRRLTRRKAVVGDVDLLLPPDGGALFEQALTHRSFAFEQPEPIGHNERLEFLGDAVLGIVVTDLIYVAHPGLPEGDLAKLRAALVNTHALAGVARSLGLGARLRLGKGEEASGGRDKDSLLADSFEAVIGALYLERGLDAVSEAIVPIFTDLMEAQEGPAAHDAKTLLQEVAVRDKGSRPVYRIASSGPDHDKRFTAHVFISDELCGSGAGRSKKEAEQQAARVALERRSGEGASGARAS